jgi:hypothetical protein
MTSKEIQVLEILVHADFHQGHALIFVEVNVCFDIKSFSDSEVSPTTS